MCRLYPAGDTPNGVCTAQRLPAQRSSRSSIAHGVTADVLFYFATALRVLFPLHTHKRERKIENKIVEKF